MKRLFNAACIGTIAMTWLLSVASAERPPRFAVLFADGSRADGESVSGWHEANATPVIGDKRLLDAANPMRWLRDRTLFPAAAPRAFIETVCGDRLPGEVINFRPEIVASYDPMPGHFSLEPSVVLKPPQSRLDEIHPIRVHERFVRRIVWQRRDRDRYEPGTLFYRDGRRTTFRAAQFGEDFVSLLLPDGTRRALFSEIAEIHLPAKDAWDSYFDELVALSADGKTPLLQLETTGGLIVTSSLARFDAAVQGNPADSSRWVHALQPAWSMDLIWIPNTDVWVRRLFAPHEVPLSRIYPSSSAESSLLGGAGRAWRRNRNVQDGPLASGDDEFGWGFGVHAMSELRFEFPACAKSFRSRVGLDRVAGPGGCVRARVFVGTTDGPPQFESPFLVGSANHQDTGVIALPDTGQLTELVLQVDPAHDGRPKGADPLDIRDMADWFDPLVALDAAKLREEIRRRVPRYFPAWRDWTASLAAGDNVEIANYRDPVSAGPGWFALGSATHDKPLTLRRQLKLGSEDKWLLLFVSRQGGAEGPQIEIRAGGETLAKQEIPVRAAGNKHVTPIAVSLAGYQGVEQLELEIIQHPGKEPTPIRWQAIRVAEQLPTLNQLFEDRGKFAPVELVDFDPALQGTAELYEDDKHFGARSIKLTPGGQFRMKLRDRAPIRQEPGFGEYRYLRFAFRKFGAGRISLELNHTMSGEKPVRYDAGLGDPCWGGATRVWLQQLPSEWIVMTRDLYLDFGELDVTGLTLSAPDGQYALFDHIYLARTMTDLDSIPAPPVEVINQNARRELARPLIEQGLPATVAIETSDGRFATGVTFTKDGQILTAGHVFAIANKDVKIHLADGRTVAGKTQGVFREIDVALVKITEAGEYPFTEINAAEDLSGDSLYVSLSHRRVFETGAQPVGNMVEIRRVFRTSVWSGLETEDWCAGGPLLDHQGKLVGIHTRRSQFGGFLYARTNAIQAVLPRLQAGETWGGWLHGTGPVIGVVITTVTEGCKVIEIGKDSPAAKAGVQLDDIVTRVEGKSVVSLDDIYAILADKDPGQEVTIEILRDKKKTETKIPLVPRVP